MHPRLLLVLLLAVHAPAHAGTVVIEGGTWRDLLPPDILPEEAPRDVAVAERTVRLVPVDGAVRVEVTWRLEPVSPGWFSDTLLGGEAHVLELTWNGRPAPAVTEGGLVVAGRVDGPTTIRLVAEIPGDPRREAISIPLLGAVRGVVVAEVAAGEAPLLTADGQAATPGPAGFWTGARALSYRIGAATAAVRADLAVAHVGVGLTVGDADLRAKAHLRWDVRQGALDRVSFTVPGAGADLDVKGPNVRAVHRSGDRVEVELQREATSRVDLEARWTVAVPTGSEASVPVPRITVDGAFRVDGAVQVARDGEIEVVPELSGWESVPASGLPPWAEGLVEGTPTAAYRSKAAPGGGALKLYRFEPVSQPAVLVDVAAFQIATASHGRTLVRAHFEVRNERASHLRVMPPPGSRILGVRVRGETATPVTDGGEGWLVPLERSVETVEGLLSFPVEVVLLGETAPWSRSDRRELPLPRVDAPIAVARTTIYLPPGWSSRLPEGEGGQVVAFTEGDGITYGFGVGDVGAAQADALFQQAVDRWMDNDFENAQATLDQLRELGASNENIAKLQSNLDVVEGRAEDKDVDVALERRVKDQARARGVEEERLQQEYARVAKEKEAAGDYSGASSYYSASLDLGKKLQKLEQDESVELESRNAALAEALSRLEQSVASTLDGEKKSKSKAVELPPADEAQVFAKQMAEERERGREAERRAFEQTERELEAAIQSRDMLDAMTRGEEGFAPPGGVQAAELARRRAELDATIVSLGGEPADEGEDAAIADQLAAYGYVGGESGSYAGEGVGREALERRPGGLGSRGTGAGGGGAAVGIGGLGTVGRGSGSGAGYGSGGVGVAGSVSRGASGAAAGHAITLEPQPVQVHEQRIVTYDFDAIEVTGELVAPEGLAFGNFGVGTDTPVEAPSGDSYEDYDGVVDEEDVLREPAAIDRYDLKSDAPKPARRPPEAKPDPAPPPPEPPTAPPPRQSRVTLSSPEVTVSARGGPSLPSFGARKAPPAPPPAAAEAPESISIGMGDDALAAPKVTASALSVVIPSAGEAVRFQHLLLPPGAEVGVPLRAKELRRTRGER